MDMKEEELLGEASRVAESARELQEEVAAAEGRRYGDEQALRQRVSALDSLLRHVCSSLKARPAELDPKISEKIALGGRYSREFFNRYGDLRHIRRLRFWPLNKVLIEKYDFNERDANGMAEFLVPILDFVPEKRPTAGQLLLHPWLDAGPFTREPAQPPNREPVSTNDSESDKQRKEKEKEKEREERDAMAVELGNIAIDISSKIAKDAKPNPSSVVSSR